MKRFNSVVAATAAAVLMLAGLAVPTVGAQTSATIDIVASIGVTPTLSVTVCDSSVVFGSGLTNAGLEPIGADPGVFATSQGTNPGEGAYYVWESECSPTVSLSSNVHYIGTICATENSADNPSPDVQVSQGDLRFATFHATPRTYAFWDHDPSMIPVPSNCFGGGQAIISSDPGERMIDLSLALRVDDGDENGNFSSQAMLGIFAQ